MRRSDTLAWADDNLVCKEIMPMIGFLPDQLFWLCANFEDHLANLQVIL